MAETVWCTKCGAVVPSTDRFCLQCGAENVEFEFDDTPTTSDNTPQTTIPVPNGRHGHPRRSLLVAAVVAAVLIVALAGVGIHQLTSPTRTSEAVGSASVPASSQPTATTSAPATTNIPVQPVPSSAPATTQAPDPELAALAALNQQRAADLSTTPRNGQWVAQLSSKYDGIVDPLQTTASGSHTFHNADILAEFQRFQRRDLGGAPLTLLLSTDYGQKQTVSGQALWVTFALPAGLTSANAVQSWCSTYFAPLTGPALADTCTPTQLF